MYFIRELARAGQGMADIFISYKKERRQAAAHLAKILELYGYTVWFDSALVKGADFAAQIDAKVREAKAVVVLWCARSVHSEWVNDEAALAADLGSLVPAMIEPCELRVDMRRKDYVNLTAWTGNPYDDALHRLLDAIKPKVGRPPKLDYDAMREYVEIWRTMNSPSLKDFTLEAPVKEDRKLRDRPVRPAPEPRVTPAERDWEGFGIAESEDVEEIGTYIKHYEASEPLWALRGRKRLAVVKAALAAEEERKRQEAEAGYRAEGRIRVAAALPRPAGLEWFLPGAGKVEGFKDADFAPEMVVVPAGEFWMGSKDAEGDPDERPRHKVTIPKPFAVGRYAVTFDEWDAAVAGGGVQHKPSDQGWGRGGRPVIDVSWEDAQAYIKWLSSKTGQPHRLLSEAEWEYCCRAGTETAYSFGNSITKAQAQFSEGSYGSAGKTVEAGSFPANSFGLYDMHGNVWEWCQDCWNENYHNAPADGLAWTTGDRGRRVLRGGSWYDCPRYLRSADRSWNGADNRGNSCGFRLARTLNY